MIIFDGNEYLTFDDIDFGQDYGLGRWLEARALKLFPAPDRIFDGQKYYSPIHVADIQHAVRLFGDYCLSRSPTITNMKKVMRVLLDVEKMIRDEAISA